MVYGRIETFSIKQVMGIHVRDDDFWSLLFNFWFCDLLKGDRFGDEMSFLVIELRCLNPPT